jgi:hypothetical protein
VIVDAGVDGGQSQVRLAIAGRAGMHTADSVVMVVGTGIACPAVDSATGRTRRVGGSRGELLVRETALQPVASAGERRGYETLIRTRRSA